MRIRNIGIFFTIMMFMILGLTIFLFSKSSTDRRNMVDYSERMGAVISALQDSSDTDAIQAKYDCVIIFRDDAMYESRLMSVIAADDVVMDYEKDGMPVAKVAFPGKADHYEALRHATMLVISGIITGVLAAGYLVLILLYNQYERPFHKLQNFAQNVARGNLDIPLKMEKNNYFGAFTESFDLMRTELKAAKESEYRANASKKELMAELSHDMKTPIATIKASSEVMYTTLACGRSREPQYYLDKLSVVIKKADMMNQLIDNMFHATLEELQTLKVNATEQSSAVVSQILKDQQDYIGIHFEHEVPEMLVYIDTLRFGQVVDNIVNNACKYAGTDLFADYMEKDNGLLVKLYDKGPGADEEELALLTQKFYKGRNGKSQNGAGLGLYLADYFMQQMGGSFSCYNENGFVTELFLRKV